MLCSKSESFQMPKQGASHIHCETRVNYIYEKMGKISIQTYIFFKIKNID